MGECPWLLAFTIKELTITPTAAFAPVGVLLSRGAPGRHRAFFLLVTECIRIQKLGAPLGLLA